jgi:hypothetical protein
MNSMELARYCKTDRQPYTAIVMLQSPDPIRHYIVYGERRGRDPLTLFSGRERGDADSAFDNLVTRYTLRATADV